MKEINLTQGQVTRISDDKFEELNQYKWYALWNGHTRSFYAVRNKRLGGKQIGLRMSRVILNAPPGMVVDHINGDTLDNQNENLRIITNRQNIQNPQKAKSSIYPGVWWSGCNKKWSSQISINGKRIHLGLFRNEQAAFLAYLNACKVHGCSIDILLDRFGGLISEMEGFN